jgi:cell division protein FtsB
VPARAERRRPSGRSRGSGRPAGPRQPAAESGNLGRSRLVLLGAVVASAVILFAWFPFSSLVQQRTTLLGTQAQLSSLHKQDAALSQETKNLSDDSEIGRIAREQYQLVTPGQQAYEVLPPAGSSASGTPLAGDPGSTAPVAPTAASELPPGGVTTTTAAPAHASQKAGKTTAQPGSGMLSRMLHALEFWR